MLITTSGIVLRSVKYSETSLILDVFTRDFGVRTFIVSGARKKNSTTGAALFQVGNIIEFVAYNRENTKINRIKEGKILKLFNRLNFEIMRFSIALFFLEILAKTIKEKQINHELYDFAENTLLFIDQTDHITANIHLCALCEMTKLLGFSPENDFSDENIFFDLREGRFVSQLPDHADFLEKNESLLFSSLLTVDVRDSHLLIFDKLSRKTILEKLILYYKIHLADFGKVKTLEVFKSIFT